MVKTGYVRDVRDLSEDWHLTVNVRLEKVK